MRFGLALPHYDTSYQGEPASWERVLATATAAERSGFDSLWVSDHLFLDWNKYGGSAEPRGSLECWTTLAALAGSTHGVRLGSLTLCNDLRNPALVAKMAATLDRLSGGRLDLGLGAGWYEPEYRASGIPFERPGIRIDRLRESLLIIGRLLEGEELSFTGDHYSVDGAICRPGPLQSPRPPLWVGGKGDRLLATIVEAADGWNFSWLGDVDLYRQRLDRLRAECDRRDRDIASIRRSVGVYLLAGEDESDARRRFERLRTRTPTGVMQAITGSAAVSWDEFRAGRFAGSVNEVTERLGELADLGVDEVIITLGVLPFQLSDIDDVEFVGTRVVGSLRNGGSG